jgi:hypothetical protein
VQLYHFVAPLDSSADRKLSSPMFYFDLFRALNAHQVRYMVVGGLAMNLHGVPRLTMDVDLVVALDADNLRRFLAAATQLGLTPGVPVAAEELLRSEARRSWIEEKGMTAFPFKAPTPETPTVDILIDPSLISPTALERAQRRDVGGIEVFLIEIEDLIEMKRHAGRRQDQADVEQLQRMIKSRDDDK